MTAPSIDLSTKIGSARDQGRRQTCLSFACSDGHQIAHSHPSFFSPESLHSTAASLMKVPVDAPVNLPAIDASLRKDGQVEEICWPYGGAKIDPNGTIYFGSAGAQLIDQPVLLSLLASGQAVGLALSIDQAFYSVGSSVLLGSQWTNPVAKHAVLAIGCRPNGSQVEILVRNSWGENWGVSGHCWCEFSYLSRSAMFMFSVSAKK